MNTEEASSYLAIAITALVSAFIGVGQLLAQPAVPTMRQALGRAIVSSGVGTSAWAALVLVPNAPMPLIVGLSCLLASLGTTGLQLLARRLLGVGQGAYDDDGGGAPR